MYLIISYYRLIVYTHLKLLLLPFLVKQQNYFLPFKFKYKHFLATNPLAGQNHLLKYSLNYYFKKSTHHLIQMKLMFRIQRDALNKIQIKKIEYSQLIKIYPGLTHQNV